jgi:hypothetical protein
MEPVLWSILFKAFYWPLRYMGVTLAQVTLTSGSASFVAPNNAGNASWAFVSRVDTGLADAPGHLSVSSNPAIAGGAQIDVTSSSGTDNSTVLVLVIGRREY